MSKIRRRNVVATSIFLLSAISVLLLWYISVDDVLMYFVKQKKDKMVEVHNLCNSAKTFQRHTKVLSYSIYGEKMFYYEGIAEVIKEKRKLRFFDDWHIRLHHDGNVPEDIRRKYEHDTDIHFCDGRNLPQYGNLSTIFKMLWRVVPIADPTVDLFCSRDLDSALYPREVEALKEFISSGLLLHTMRDHPQHGIGMLGGMWCFQNKVNRTLGTLYLKRIIEKAELVTVKEDQTILNKVIWSDLWRKDLHYMILQHDSYICERYKDSKSFPTERRNMEFIGCPGHICGEAKMKPCPEICRPPYGKSWTYC